MKSTKPAQPQQLTFIPDSLELEQFIRAGAKAEGRSISNWISRQLTLLMIKERDNGS